MLICSQYGSCNLCLLPSVFFPLSESEQREQRQPVAGSHSQESGDRRESGGKSLPHPVKRSEERQGGRSVCCVWVPQSLKAAAVPSVLRQTCAHLYELRQRVNKPSETRDPIGRCYVLSEDLTERDDLDGGEWKFCEGRPQGHEQFGFCQQGLSVSFTPDNNFILFGAPGTYNWKGMILIVSQKTFFFCCSF